MLLKGEIWTTFLLGSPHTCGPHLSCADPKRRSDCNLSLAFDEKSKIHRNNLKKAREISKFAKVGRKMSRLKCGNFSRSQYECNTKIAGFAQGYNFFVFYNVRDQTLQC